VAANGAIEVEIGRVERNPHQPRKQIDEERLAELAESILQHGVIQPLVVTRLADQPGAGASAGASAGTGPRYRLIAGERRWQAAKRAGLARVPVVVREATPRQFLELALVENVQRADLNPIEEAAAYQQLAEGFGLTQEEIGTRVGKNRVTVANTLRLLQLPASVQQAVIDGAVTEGHARALLQLRDRTAQERAARQVVERGLSVRETEGLVRRTLMGLESRAPRRLPPALGDAPEIEERFRDALGTKVSLSRGKRGGRLVIYYYDDEQLQALYERLAGPDGA
jgi:ParB family chromosome partitioning protein